MIMYLPLSDWLASALVLLTAAALVLRAESYLHWNGRTPDRTDMACFIHAGTMYIAAMLLAWLPLELMAP